MPKVVKRKPSLGEHRELERRKQAFKTTNTYTYSERVGELHYYIIQAVRDT